MDRHHRHHARAGGRAGPRPPAREGHPPLNNDHTLAAALATEAGELLLRVRSQHTDSDASVRKAEGDRRAHELLVTRLAETCPADAVLSEEGKDDPVRLISERVWIVDPLDGTREFSELDRDDWAVHVALWERGDLVAGAVALPSQGVTLATPGASAVATTGDRVRLVVSRTRPPTLVTTLADQLGAELIPMGSAGAKAMSVLHGTSDAYVHAGGQYEWDSAAPAAVATAAGLHCSRLDGSPLVYNQPDVWLPDLVICRPDLAGTLLATIRALLADVDAD